MRIPVPERFTAKPVGLFIMALFLGQMITGTDLTFALLTSVYVILFALGFNLGGGFLYVSGAYIFFNGILCAILGLTYKVLLFIPGDKFLSVPTRTMECYCAGMAAMGLAAYLSRLIAPARGLLSNVGEEVTLKRAAIGCLVFGAVIQLVTANSGEGTLGSAFRQLNHFVQMAIILATVYEIKRTNGKRSLNWIVLAGAAWTFAFGLMNFGKEGIFLGPATWLIACIARGFDFPKKQLVAIVIAFGFITYYLVPYSQYVRIFRSTSRSENMATAIKYLGNLNETRQLYLDSETGLDPTNDPHLFGTPQGFFDRLNMLAIDDPLIQLTDNSGTFGLLPTLDSYSAIVPRFLWRNKPSFNYGNEYAHSIGLLASDDDTTGISFSPTADAYHEEGWYGILVILPGVTFLYFFVTNSLVGGAKDAPWALLPIALVSHVAPEGLMEGTIYLTTYGAFGLIVIFVFSRYLLPIMTGVFSQVSETEFLAVSGMPRAIRTATASGDIDPHR